MIDLPSSLLALHDCCLCPRQCKVDRFAGPTGFCRTDAGYAIGSVTLHRGEEPVISGAHGLCNVFFGHCNLRCSYCQNFQISRNENRIKGAGWSLATAVEAIIEIFQTTGGGHLGFVSPSHMVPQMVAIVREVQKRGYRPVIVYNSNGYDRVATLQQLEEVVDVYLPDCKYMDPVLAEKWSGAADYPVVAAAALREMYRQKGHVLHLDDTGMAQRGLIVRHLVLPGAVDNSLAVLRFLARELSSRIALSLMAQYRPIAAVAEIAPLNRRLLPTEYAQVETEMERWGFTQGWVQELCSADTYHPDFERDAPFGE
jgi:putative pyruvate formate lyase activating enzyme